VPETSWPGIGPFVRFATLPGSLPVRELRDRIDGQGFRTNEITLVTTLVDAEIYTAEELAGVYDQRWSIETSFAHLKTTMNINVLKCETVDGVS
jgi:hypothetical protein